MKKRSKILIPSASHPLPHCYSLSLYQFIDFPKSASTTLFYVPTNYVCVLSLHNDRYWDWLLYSLMTTSPCHFLFFYFWLEWLLTFMWQESSSNTNVFFFPGMSIVGTMVISHCAIKSFHSIIIVCEALLEVDAEILKGKELLAAFKWILYKIKKEFKMTLR